MIKSTSHCNAIRLNVSISVFLESLMPQVHRLCLLQVRGKWARSRRSIQARQRERPMTVQYRRELEKCISTLQSGWTQGSDRTKCAPKVDAGEQGAWSQQDGCL